LRLPVSPRPQWSNVVAETPGDLKALYSAGHREAFAD
jgi:hypothetical protein